MKLFNVSHGSGHIGTKDSPRMFGAPTCIVCSCQICPNRIDAKLKMTINKTEPACLLDCSLSMLQPKQHMHTIFDSHPTPMLARSSCQTGFSMTRCPAVEERAPKNLGINVKCNSKISVSVKDGKF